MSLVFPPIYGRVRFSFLCADISAMFVSHSSALVQYAVYWPVAGRAIIHAQTRVPYTGNYHSSETCMNETVRRYGKRDGLGLF